MMEVKPKIFNAPLLFMTEQMVVRNKRNFLTPTEQQQQLQIERLEADYKDKYSTALTDRPLWKQPVVVAGR